MGFRRREGARTRTLRRVCAIVLLAWPVLAGAARGDDAVVLPRDRSSVALENLFYLPTGQRWGPNGNAEDLASGFDNRRLDSSVFTLLQPLDALVGGSASIGDSHVKFEYRYDILNFSFAYGLTDRLTVGVEIPYYWAQNNVRASVDSGPGSSANVGLKTGPGAGLCGLPVAVLPLACPNTRRFTTEDVQQVLGPGLPGIPGFGYKRIEDFSDDGLGDIVLGGKYQYLRTRDWRLAASGGVRFPTGRQDDPDDLSDVSWSSGAWGLLARMHHDYLVSNLWKERPTPADKTPIAEPGDLVLDFTFRYEWVLPDRATLRVGDPNALTTNRERVGRDLGDRFEFELSGRYSVRPGLSLSALYKYGFKLEDRMEGHKGYPTQVLEEDTGSTEQLYMVLVSYSTLPLYRAGRFPLPLDITLSYRDRFAGSGPRTGGSPSQVLKTRYIGLRVQALF